MPSYARVSPWLSCILYPLGCYLLIPSYFGKLEITGQEQIPTSGPVLLASTHRSRWDALVIPYTAGRCKTGRDLHFMVSANEMKGVQGWFIHRMGGFPVNPKRPGLSSFRESVKLLCEGKVLVIFPEGDIFRQQPVQPLKAGLGRIALQAELQRQVSESVKIVPISLHYSQAYPQWGTNVRVAVGSPLDTANYDIKQLKESSQQLNHDIEQALKTLHENNQVGNLHLEQESSAFYDYTN